MVGNVKDLVRRSTSEREAREGLVNQGKVAAAQRQRAPLRLQADARAEGPAGSDEQSAEALEVRVATRQRTRQADVAQGVEGARERHRPTGRPFRQRAGAPEAPRAASACRPPPEGQARWRLKRLADQRVPLERVAAIGQETGRRPRKTLTASRGGKTKGASRRRATRASSARWKPCGR